jgi:hypothetical protein
MFHTQIIYSVATEKNIDLVKQLKNRKINKHKGPWQVDFYLSEFFVSSEAWRNLRSNPPRLEKFL